MDYSSKAIWSFCLVGLRDAVGNVLVVLHPNEAGSLRDVLSSYDRLNRPLTENSGGVAQTHSYDAAGNRLTTVYGGTSRLLAFGYDALNRTSRITDSTSSLNTSYSYDLSGNMVEKILANGLVEVRTHDGRNRTSTLDNQTGGVNVAGYAYSYDAAGNVMQVTETYPGGSLDNRTITNAYDGVYRLLTEAIATTGGSTVTTTYLYDKGHNRTSKTVSGGTTTAYVIGTGSNGAGANQIVSETTAGVTTAYAYDANGNRSAKTVETNTDVYSYDDENRLIELDYLTGTSGTGTYAYAYDYRTRRVTRTEPGPVTTHLSFDGGTSILEYGSAGAANPNVEYVRGYDYGGGVGGLEYSIRSGSARFNSYDSRGDVTTQTDATGAVAFQTAYEAFGDQTATSGSTPDRQRASTKEQDPTGLLNEGFRYRDPSTGTFLTRDPLGFKDGLNTYTYVRQNPWTHFDAEGLSIWSAVENNAHLVALGAGAAWADTGGRLMGGHGSGLTAENYRQAGLAGAKAGAVFAVGAAVTVVTAGAAAPVIAGAIGVGATATVATGVVAGGGGAAAAQMTSNVLNGQPATKNVGQAALVGAAFGGVGALAGETAAAF